MRSCLRPLALVAIALIPCAAYAAPQPAPMPAMSPDMMTMMMAHHASTVTVTGVGSVDYTPDEARITLGVEGEAPSAQAAVGDISNRANAVINALKGMGIPASNITTSGFNLFYRQPTETVKGAYVASESVSFKTSVDKTGTAIDAGIRAGANQSYGLSFDTTQRDALYKQAVQRAVKQARELADVAASAAGVRLGSVVSISLGGAPGFAPPVPMARLSVAVAAAPPPVEPGTGSIQASVSVTYAVAGTTPRP
ncbi:MAG TPA: SIMPL domain-containing protein [Candidatus Binatus sp.]|nr:SIMPL domain-containing protein [Candidatus Binatus sp.]